MENTIWKIWIKSIRSGILRKEWIIDWAGLLPWRDGNDAWKCLKVSESLGSIFDNFTTSISLNIPPAPIHLLYLPASHHRQNKVPPTASRPVLHLLPKIKMLSKSAGPATYMSHIWQFKTLGRLISQEGKMKMIKDCLNLKASNVAQSTLSAKPSPPRRRCICPTK